jgi:hypothetical protein
VLRRATCTWLEILEKSLESVVERAGKSLDERRHFSLCCGTNRIRRGHRLSHEEPDRRARQRDGNDPDDPHETQAYPRKAHKVRTMAPVYNAGTSLSVGRRAHPRGSSPGIRLPAISDRLPIRYEHDFAKLCAGLEAGLSGRRFAQ